MSLNSDTVIILILESGRSWVQAPVGSKPNAIKLIFVASSLNTPLRRKSKDWLARNQNIVSEWLDMSTRTEAVKLRTTFTDVLLV
jgi:hypothetical protein